MKRLQSRGKEIHGQILWKLEGLELDFSLAEFQDLVEGVKEGGLFEYLRQERPALLLQLETLCEDLRIEREDRETLLEQSLFDLRDILRLP